LQKTEIAVKATRNFSVFNKVKCQFSERDNLQSGHEASTSTSNLQQTIKRVCVDMLTEAEGSKNQREFASHYDKKHLQLGFTAASCSKQMPQHLFCMLPNLSNDVMKPS